LPYEPHAIGAKSVLSEGPASKSGSMELPEVAMHCER